MELAHGADELLGRERLPQHGCADVDDELLAVVAGHEQHGKLRIRLPQPLRDRVSAHARHQHVQDGRVHVAALDRRDRRHAVAHAHHLEPGVLEDGAVEKDEVWAVVGDEDAHSRLVTQTDPRLSSPRCVGGGCLCRSGWRLSGCACMPHDCELVQIGGKPAGPNLPFLHVVGRATFRSGAPLSAYFAAAGSNRPPILLADGVAGLARTPLPDAPLIARTYGWVVPLSPRSVHDWDLARLGSRIDSAQSQLEEKSDIFSVQAPLDTIAGVRATSRVAGERLLILGGDASALLLGFAVLASTRLRRDQRAVRRRLTWFGATRSQIVLVAATEVVGITLVSSLVGWAAGTGAGALLARHLGSPGRLVVEHSALTTSAFAAAAALAVVTALVVLAALQAESI